MSPSTLGASTAGDPVGIAHLGHAELHPPLPWHGASVSRPGARVVDGAMLVLAALLVTVSVPSAQASSPVWAGIFGLCVIGILSSRGEYKCRLEARFLDGVRAILTATALAAAIVISTRVLLGSSEAVAADAVRLWLIATMLLLGGRLSIAVAKRRGGAIGAGGTPTLIVGAGKVGHLVADRLRARPDIGLRPVGFLDKEPLGSADGRNGSVPPVLGASWDLDAVVAQHGIRHVIVTFSTAPTDVVLRLLDRCAELGVRTSFVPRLFEKTSGDVTIDRLGGLPIVSTHPADPRGWQFALKYALDRVAAAAALVALSPLLIALALAVLISSGRPVLYRQERVGRDGKPFGMLKFRSMRPSTGGESTQVTLAPGTAPGGVEGVDRRTRIGGFMRRTSLDELPQILNVLKGEMSLVGPRPERPEFVDVFEQTTHRYGERHRVKGGITGWAQVHGLRGKTSVADRAEWDNFYIENWSLWLDFKIFLLTLMAVVRPGAVE